MILFDKKGIENTAETARIAVQRAKQDGLDMVIASINGRTAEAVLEAAKAEGYSGRMVIVASVSSPKHDGKNIMSREKRAELLSRGIADSDRRTRPEWCGAGNQHPVWRSLSG